MADLQNQIIALRRQIDRLNSTDIVFNQEPKNPNTQTVYVNSATGETKYWTGKEWVITSGTGGGGLTGWNTTVVFTATDYRTIAWTTGVVSIGTTTSKTDYATTSGNFTMAATTYFYWQADNPTAIQTTSTAGNVVIAGGVLIAVGRMNADTANLASLKVFGGPSVDQIIADEIVANSITSNMLQANSITASKLATTLLYAGAITLDTNGLIKGGQTAYDTGTGFFLGYSTSTYKFSIGNSAGNKLTWDGTTLAITGSLTATTGAIGGWTINSTSIYTGTEDHSGYTANAGNMTIYSDGTDSSIHAKNFYIDTTGSFYATGGTLDGTSSLGGRLASTLATAIDSSGHFADAAISTASQSILGAFTFGASGAIQIGTYLVGVTGDIRISPTGILGRNSSGATTFSINATTGVAVLNGLVVGTNVGLGTAQTAGNVTTIIGSTVTTSFINALNVNAATVSASISITTPNITGGTLQTATSGARIVLTSASGIQCYDASVVRLRMPTDGSGMTFFNPSGTSVGRIQGQTPGSGTFSGVHFIEIDNNGTSGDGNLLVDNKLISGGDTYFCVLGTSYTATFSGKMRIPVGSNLY